MSSVFHPWRLARQRSIGRIVVQSVVLAAMLFAIGLHGARACTLLANAFAQAEAMADPCHQRAPTLDACTVHCESDGQSTRLASVDLPALAPVFAMRIQLPVPIVADESHAGNGDAWQRAGPPLHILLQRSLR